MPRVVKQSNKTRRTRKKKESVIDRIQSISFDERGLRIVMYGLSGTGKTTLWSTFPGKIIAIICSGGKKPGELLSLNTPELKKKVDYIVVNSSAEVGQLIEHQQQTRTYSTMVLDHVTDFQNMILTEVVGLDEIPEQLSWGLASQQEYGQVSLQTKTYLGKLFSLDCNVVVIGQQRTFNERYGEELADEESSIDPFICPALTPSTVSWLLSATDYTVQTFIRKKYVEKKYKIKGKTKTRKIDTGDVEYCIRTAPDPIYATKFRKPKERELPKCIVDPSYDKIMEIVNATK